MYLLDVLVVVVHISHSNCWSTYYCTRIEVSVLRAGRGHGVEFLSSWYFFLGVILGCLGRPTPPPGGHAGSGNDTLLPMTMTCDRLKFWSGPAWLSKVIIRKPWRRKNKKKRKKIIWQNHKAFPAGSRECLINHVPSCLWEEPSCFLTFRVCIFFSF